jgi:hypothetical protein
MDAQESRRVVIPPSAEVRVQALVDAGWRRDQAERFVAATMPHELEPEHLMWREWTTGGVA